MMKKRSTLAVISAVLCIYSSHTAANQGPVIMDSGLEYIDLLVGTGAVVGPDSVVVLHITGWLNENGRKGLKFISTYDREKPVAFKVGTDRVMKAWSMGVLGMRTGGKRRLFVPPELGYGEKSVVKIVPPNAELIFDIELLEVN
jgi:FKBP-type peptidyl-prolyl cis-trans isomerase